MNFLRNVLAIALLLLSLNSHAQEKYKITEKDYNNTEVEMADVMRQNGKIYVVVGVIFIIFAGIIFYLIRLDKKVSSMEKELKIEG
ncbi:MAG: CcmD family protein [Reichenbachiella sp.]